MPAPYVPLLPLSMLLFTHITPQIVLAISSPILTSEAPPRLPLQPPPSSPPLPQPVAIVMPSPHGPTQPSFPVHGSHTSAKRKREPELSPDLLIFMDAVTSLHKQTQDNGYAVQLKASCDRLRDCCIVCWFLSDVFDSGHGTTSCPFYPIYNDDAPPDHSHSGPQFRSAITFADPRITCYTCLFPLGCSILHPTYAHDPRYDIVKCPFVDIVTPTLYIASYKHQKTVFQLIAQIDPSTKITNPKQFFTWLGETSAHRPSGVLRSHAFHLFELIVSARISV